MNNTKTVLTSQNVVDKPNIAAPPNIGTFERAQSLSALGPLSVLKVSLLWDL
jgi:hypothetical protein